MAPIFIPLYNTGPGSTIGCLGTIPLGLKPQESAGEGAGTSVPKKSASHLKNFYTNPSKKGGAGYDFAARTIGGKQPFGYITDEYQSGIRLTKEERKTMRARISKPFSAGGTSSSSKLLVHCFLFRSQLLKKSRTHGPESVSHYSLPH